MASDPIATSGANPIIVVGNPRSGTTLLRLMLTSHARICIPPEGPVIGMLEPRYGRVRDPDDSVVSAFAADVLAVPKLEEWRLDPERLALRLRSGPRADYADLLDGVYREYMDTLGERKPRWGDKSSSYTISHLERIRRALPRASVIHIVRDGRDVACSYRALRGIRGKYAPVLPSGVLRIAYEWRRNLRRIRRFLSRWPPEQQFELRYEDLVRSPAAILELVCGALGERYDPAMLDFHRLNRERSLEPAVYMAWKAKTAEAVSDSQVGRFQRELTPADEALFRAMAGDLLRSYSYLPPDAPRCGLLRTLRARGFAGRAAVADATRRWVRRTAAP